MTIEEERKTLDDWKKKGFKDTKKVYDPTQYDPQKVPDEPIKKNKYQKRAEQFWDDIKGMVALLNAANREHQIQDIRHPTITNYLLWRILNEIKKTATLESDVEKLKSDVDNLLKVIRK